MQFKFHFWYVTFSVFFAALLIFGYRWLDTFGLFMPWMPLEDFVLITLATMRLVRLFTYDIITKFIRDWFAGAEPETFRGTLGALIGCPWCSGLWFAATLVFLYYLSPIAWYVILILAVASVASFFQLLANLVGWSAEAKKRQVEG